MYFKTSNKKPIILLSILTIIFIFSYISKLKAQENDEILRIHSSNPINIIKSEIDGIEIGTFVETYEDKTGRLNLKTLLNKINKIQFEKSQKGAISKGFNTNPIWIKFTINNKNTSNDEFYLEVGYHLLDDIQFFIPVGEGEYKVIRAGDTKPFHQRKFNHPNFIFKFLQNKGETTYFLRVQTTSSLSIPLNLWTKTTLRDKLQIEYVFRGIFYGLIIVMLIYNFIIFFFTKAITYFYYVLFICSLIFLSLALDGMGFCFIWSNYPWWNNSLGFVMPLVDINVFIFSMIYLKMKESTPKLYMGMLAFIAIYLLIGISSFIMPYSKVIKAATAMQALGIFYLIYVGIFYILRKKSRMALYFVPAHLVMLIGVGLSTLKASGTLSANFLTTWGFQIGTGLEAILFSLGLADRLNEMKNILRNMNILLERKVEERTEELSAAMKELKLMNVELIDTRDQLWGEMELAKKIQTVLLPEKPKINGYDIVGYMQAADEVGGDYYDVINAEGYDWVVIGDVSGHGVPAGLIMMMVQTAIHVAIKQKPESDPSDLLIDINQIITENINHLSESKYMTITVFVALQNGKLIFSGLHQDFFIYRHATKSLNIVETSGIWLGLMEDITGMLENYSVELSPGDSMILYTDGVTEATDPEENMYSDEKLMEIFQQNGHLSPEEIKNTIIQSLEHYKKTDDVTFLIIKRN